MALLKCTRCWRHPPEGREPFDATKDIYWLGVWKPASNGRRKREIIHLGCMRRFWTNSPAVLNLDLYSLKHRKVVPKGTRLDAL
jgi:hypothetical protein